MAALNHNIGPRRVDWSGFAAVSMPKRQLHSVERSFFSKSSGSHVVLISEQCGLQSEERST
jgi:hypothetical protein